MNIAIKAVLAFGIGVAAMIGLQTAGLLSVKQYLYSDSARRRIMPDSKVTTSFDSSKICCVVLPKMPPIDTSMGERAAASAIHRQIDLHIRAGDAVPRPRTYPGMPRY
jgi:hypothetical protein